MGNEPFCDFCRKNTRVETALQAVKVGEKLVGEACLTCASSIKTNLSKVISDAATQMEKAAAALPAAAPAAPPAAAPGPISGISDEPDPAIPPEVQAAPGGA